jgi:hypothetical protein
MTLRLTNACLDLVHRLVEAVFVGLRMRTDPAIAVLPMVAEHEQLVDLDHVPLAAVGDEARRLRDRDGIDRVPTELLASSSVKSSNGLAIAAGRRRADAATRRATILPALRCVRPWWFVLRRLR